MRVVLLIIGLMGVGLIAVGSTLELSDTFEVDDSVNLWATVLSYPRNTPRSAYGEELYEVHLFHPRTGQKWLLADGYGTYGTEGYPDATQWSADGQWVYFAVSSNEFNSPIYRVHWTANHVETIWESEVNFLSGDVVSPDGRWVAWQEIDSSWQQLAIHVRRADGSGSRVITPKMPFGYTETWEPIHWSPDSEWVYFQAYMNRSSQSTNSANWELWRVNSDGYDLEEIFAFGEGTWLQASTVSEYGLIYATSQYQMEGVAIYRSDLDGGHSHLITTIDPAILVTHLQQPTETDVIVEYYADYNTPQRFLHLNIETGETKPLLPLEESIFWRVFGPDYSPDGHYMTIVARMEDNEWYRFVMEANGENLVVINYKNCQTEFGRESDRSTQWQGDTFYYFASPDEDHCQLMAFTAGESEPHVVRDLPTDINQFSFIRTQNAIWINYYVDQQMVINDLDGSITFPVADNGQRGSVAWTELPLREAKSQFVIIFGMIGCIGSLIGNWILNKVQSGRNLPRSLP